MTLDDLEGHFVWWKLLQIKYRENVVLSFFYSFVLISAYQLIRPILHS